MKGEIISMEKMYNDFTCTYFYQVTVSFEEIPKLKVGNCEVKQGG